MWLEVITVRTASLDELANRITSLIDGLKASAPSLAVSVYLRHPGTSDLSIHLHWASTSLEPSPLGIQLVSALCSFGSVDHALWRCLGDSDVDDSGPRAFAK